MRPTSADELQVLFGTAEEIPTKHLLRAGDLDVWVQGHALRSIQYRGSEVWHGASFLFRDRHWGTPGHIVTDQRIRRHDHGFSVEIQGRVHAPVSLDFSICIEGNDKHQIKYSVRAQAAQDVVGNRCGLVLMHPLSCCGQAIEIEHTDGRRSLSTFPQTIAPWPPFTLIRSISHQVNPGTWACAKLIGDDFELEDQRNNFDASFKTYSRSNQAPRPYVIHAGTVIEQTMMLSLKNDQGHHASLPSIAAEPCPARVQLDAQALSMPLLGVGLRASDTHLISDLLPHGLALKCRHWHLVLNHPEEEVNWNQVAQLCRATQASLRIDVGGIPHAGESNWFEELALRLQHEDLLPESIGVLSDDPLIFEQARHAFPCSRIGVGTPHFFVQLNRMKGLPKADFSTFTTSSLVHGADDDHIMLGLQSTPGIFETLQHTHAAQAMRVGPSFIAARRSPLGEQPATDGSRRVVLASTDPRDRSVFGAIWAAAYFSIFARHGAQSISLFYLTGASGLIHEQDARAACSPAFHLLALLNECDHMRAGRVDGNKHLYACALKHSGHTRLLLVNTSPEACQVNAAEWGRPTGCLIMDTQSVRNMLQTGAASTWRAGPIPDEQLLMGGYTMVLLTL